MKKKNIIVVVLLLLLSFVISRGPSLRGGDAKNGIKANVVTEIVVLETKAKEASGLEFLDDQWYVVDDNGRLFVGEKEVELAGDLEGLASCGEKLFVAFEDTGRVEIYNRDLQQLSHLETGIGGKYDGIEGIACSRSGLYVADQETSEILYFTMDGVFRDRFGIPYPDLSGLDYAGGLLYIISDEKDVIIVYDPQQREVIDEMPLAHGENWESIKILDNTAYVVEDKESGGAKE